MAQQFNFKERRLVLECKTGWNSTYDMLACAIKFKEVFSRLTLEDNDYKFCPTVSDWDKIEKLIEILKVFYDTTNIISGLEYPTSNFFFLSEVYYIKETLDKNVDSPDDFVRGMIKDIKERFDKYWGECNFLMAIGGVLDTRLKMNVVEISFPTIIPSILVRENVNKVRDTLYELYEEYKTMQPPLMEELGESRRGGSNVGRKEYLPGMSGILQLVRSGEIAKTRKSEPDVYLDEGTIIDEGYKFDVLEWWKDKSSKFCTLSRMVADVLAIPITTVASESTFSAESRIIDLYRSKLTPETVKMLICTADWHKSPYGWKDLVKGDDDKDRSIAIMIPII